MSKHKLTKKPNDSLEEKVTASSWSITKKPGNMCSRRSDGYSVTYSTYHSGFVAFDPTGQALRYKNYKGLDERLVWSKGTDAERFIDQEFPPAKPLSEAEQIRLLTTEVDWLRVRLNGAAAECNHHLQQCRETDVRVEQLEMATRRLICAIERQKKLDTSINREAVDTYVQRALQLLDGD